MTLPRPNEEELKPFNKVLYFNRLIRDMDLSTVLKVSTSVLADWISDNYDSVYLDNKELNFKR
jgi:hypothetical protein